MSLKRRCIQACTKDEFIYLSLALGGFYIYGLPQVVGLPFVIVLPFHFSSTHGGSTRGGSWLNVDATLLIIKCCSCVIKMLIFQILFTNYEFLKKFCVPEHDT